MTRLVETATPNEAFPGPLRQGKVVTQVQDVKRNETLSRKSASVRSKTSLFSLDGDEGFHEDGKFILATRARFEVNFDRDQLFTRG